MSRFLENIFVGDEKRTLQQCETQYQVDKFVADERASIAKEQLHTVLRRPAVLAAIFGVGAIKEYNADSNDKTSENSTSLMQYILFASRFI